MKWNDNIFKKEDAVMEEISKQLGEAGYDYAVAIATEAEINAKAACGQLSIIIENESNS